MPSSTNHQTPSVSSPSSSPGPIAQHLAQSQGAGQPSLNATNQTAVHSTASRHKRRAPWKEVREWLNVLGVLLISLLIGVYTIINNTQQSTLAQQSRQADVANQLDQQREATLKTYEDDLSTLLLDRHLRDSQPEDDVRIVALDKTLQVLHRLDGPRNDRAIQFLQDAQLIGVNPTTKKSHNIIDFSSANLQYDDLNGANLNGANLNGANLNGANLFKAILSGADLRGAILSQADLSQAVLFKADLTGADLVKAVLRGAVLRGAVLVKAVLFKADLTGADLVKADLVKADLRGAIVSPAQLAEAASLRGTILPDGSTHP